RVRIRRCVASVPAGLLVRRLHISVALLPKGLREESSPLDTDTVPQSQLLPVTSRPPEHKTALPARYRAIPTQSVRLQTVSGAIAGPLIRVGALREPTAYRNAPRTPPPSQAFHSTTANRGPLLSASRSFAMVQCQSDARTSACRRRSPLR